MNQSRYGLLDLEAFLSRFYVDPQTGRPRQLLLTPYAYSAQFTALAVDTSSTANINISAVADFVILNISHRATVGSTAQNVSTKTAPCVRMLITDSGSGEQFTNTAVDLETMSTNGNPFFELPYPRIVTGKSSLQVQVTNFANSDETYATLDIVLNGVQVRAFSS